MTHYFSVQELKRCPTSGNTFAAIFFLCVPHFFITWVLKIYCLFSIPPNAIFYHSLLSSSALVWSSELKWII